MTEYEAEQTYTRRFHNLPEKLSEQDLLTWEQIKEDFFGDSNDTIDDIKEKSGGEWYPVCENGFNKDELEKALSWWKQLCGDTKIVKSSPNFFSEPDRDEDHNKESWWYITNVSTDTEKRLIYTIVDIIGNLNAP